MTKKLWDTNNNDSSDQISRFLSSDDIELDKFLFTYDIDATIAHINALSNIKIIKKTELTKLKKSLKQLRKEFINGKFKLTNDYEYCHSAIEF